MAIQAARDVLRAVLERDGRTADAAATATAAYVEASSSAADAARVADAAGGVGPGANGYAFAAYAYDAAYTAAYAAVSLATINDATYRVTLEAALAAAAYGANAANIFDGGTDFGIAVASDIDVLERFANDPRLGDESGPLGPLWPDGEPKWYTDLLNRFAPEFELFIDPGSGTLADVKRILSALNELHMAYGGLGFDFKIDGSFAMAPSEVSV